MGPSPNLGKKMEVDADANASMAADTDDADATAVIADAIAGVSTGVAGTDTAGDDESDAAEIAGTDAEIAGTDAANPESDAGVAESGEVVAVAAGGIFAVITVDETVNQETVEAAVLGPEKGQSVLLAGEEGKTSKMSTKQNFNALSIFFYMTKVYTPARNGKHILKVSGTFWYPARCPVSLARYLAIISRN